MLCISLCFFWHLQGYHEQTNSAYHLFLWAQYNQFQKNHEITAYCYEHLLKTNMPHYILPGFLSFLEQTKEYEKIIQIMPTLKNSDTKNPELDIIYAHALAKVGKAKEADELFINLADKHPHHTEIVYYAIHAHMRAQNIPEAFKRIDTYLESPKPHTKNFVFNFLKAQLYSISGNIEQAIAHAEKTLAENQNFTQAWILLGMLHEQLGNYDQALLAYTKTLEHEHNPQILQQLQKLQMQKNYRALEAQEKLYKQALLLFKSQDYNSALTKINECLEMGHHDMYLVFKIELLLQLDKCTDAAEIVFAHLTQKPSIQVWYKVAHTMVMAKRMDLDTLINRLKSVESQATDNLFALLYQADLYIRNGNQEQAKIALEKALQSPAAQPDLKGKLYYQLGYIHYQNKEWDKVIEHLDKGTSHTIFYAPLYNLAAYFYAHHGNNLARAQEYCTKALAHEPNNIHFLDTQAYILYKQKSFDKAHAILSKLTKNVNHHYHFKHLAMIEKQKENVAQARSFIEKAIACTPKNCPKKIEYQHLHDTLHNA